MRGRRVLAVLLGMTVTLGCGEDLLVLVGAIDVFGDPTELLEQFAEQAVDKATDELL